MQTASEASAAQTAHSTGAVTTRGAAVKQAQHTTTAGYGRLPTIAAPVAGLAMPPGHTAGYTPGLPPPRTSGVASTGRRMNDTAARADQLCTSARIGSVG